MVNIHKYCRTCEHENQEITSEPCVSCQNNSNWEKEKDRSLPRYG